MLDLIKTIILGIIEGLTEFLPISSTGHLIVATALLQPFVSLASTPDGLATLRNTFDIFIQFGAIVALVAYYRKDIWTQVRTVRRDQQVQHFWIAIIVAFIPAAVLGLALRKFIENTLFSPVIVAISLIVGGILFLILERTIGQKETNEADTMMDVTYRQALIVGVVQVLSLIPGVSRSGASIFGGMLSGLNRQTATRFSFFLAIPTLGAATVVDLLLSLKDLHGSGAAYFAYLALGTIAAGVFAWIAVGWLLRYIAHNTFVPFGYYRIVAGIVILVLFAIAVL
ncbi:MAG TPA: undecaprenyl-diphosphate phosphatase [Phototrophicaceae bacterium]|nr:undecaprenyl-diphosphate phosphatase [Phototrophicaceae bacterium]